MLRAALRLPGGDVPPENGPALNRAIFGWKLQGPLHRGESTEPG